MSAELCLHFAAIFLSYFLRVTAAFVACWMLNRLLAKPRQRFIVWMAFLDRISGVLAGIGRQRNPRDWVQNS